MKSSSVARRQLFHLDSLDGVKSVRSVSRSTAKAGGEFRRGVGTKPGGEHMAP